MNSKISWWKFLIVAFAFIACNLPTTLAEGHKHHSNKYNKKNRDKKKFEDGKKFAH